MVKAFYAYPSSVADVTQVINATKRILSDTHRDLDLHLWEENDISGRPLTDPIFKGIESADILIADVTAINFNVTFEIGYAIGLGKRVYLTCDSNISRDSTLANKIGIFDTLGYETYTDEITLSELIRAYRSDGGIPIRSIVSPSSPVYVLQTPQSNSAMIAITARIKKARLGYKGYIPTDDARLSAVKAIDDVSSCHGAVIPLLSTEFRDAAVHNIRAAFIAGLAIAMGKVTLVLQPKDGPAPLDVRDLVRTFSSPDDIAGFIATLALDITERFQTDNPLPTTQGNFLAELAIGDSVAENEFQTLGGYYLRTDQYKRASRGEVNIVVGRKGTGKTALFSQLRNEKRSRVHNIVVDLKPEGYQLIRLKEDVLDYLADGAKTHLITALFEYLFYLEICYKVLEKDRERHMRDEHLYEPYRRLREVYDSGSAAEGDFSERLLGLSQQLIAAFKTRFGTTMDQRLTASEVTELIHKRNIRDIRDSLSAYLEFKDSIWVLFDNLDKGWSTHGLTDGDILILRCLIDAARKIQRELQRDGHDFHSVVFVRNDVYQLLVEASADYGKESRAVLDWTDADLLRELLRRRLISNQPIDDTPFDRIWSQICVSHYHGEETSQYLIDRSLMRPRNLIKLLAHCRGFAVGLERTRIEKIDLEKGLRAYSIDLITEADQELTDILGTETDLIYYFIGEGQEFERERLESILIGAEVPAEKIDDVIFFMLYYGFLGVKADDRDPKYIYELEYDMKLLSTIAAKADRLTYILNPAFHPGLNL